LKTELIGKHVNGLIPKMLIAELHTLGVSLEEVSQKIGVTPSIFGKNEKIQITTELQLWTLLEEYSNDPFLGLRLSGQLSLSQLGLFGFLLQFQTNLQEAVSLFCRYHKLLHEAATWRFAQSPEGDYLAHGFGLPGDGPGWAASLYTLAEVHRLLGELASKEIRLIEVGFQNKPPPNLEPLQAVFGSSCRFVFHQDENRITYRPNTFKQQITAQHNPALAQVLEEAAQRALTDLGITDERLGSVKQMIVDHLPKEDFSLDLVARSLGLSCRSLQRHLKTNQTSFRSLVEDARHFLSCQHLTAGVLSVMEIALLLGYEDPTSFSRAFRRWQGQSPRDFQRSKTVP